MIFQDPYSCLDPRMSIGSIIEEGMKVHFSMSSSQRQKRCQELLERVGLPREMVSRFPHELSGGQRQRIGIARALATKPAILLADEPTGNLDSRTSNDVLSLMKVTGQKFSQTMVMITHNEEIAQLADRIVRIEDGRIVLR